MCRGEDPHFHTQISVPKHSIFLFLRKLRKKPVPKHLVFPFSSLWSLRSVQNRLTRTHRSPHSRKTSAPHWSQRRWSRAAPAPAGQSMHSPLHRAAFERVHTTAQASAVPETPVLTLILQRVCSSKDRPFHDQPVPKPPFCIFRVAHPYHFVGRVPPRGFSLTKHDFTD